MTLLPEVKRVSSVSGGSITAGLLAWKWDKLKFENGIATVLKSEVVDPLLEFTSHTLDIPAVLKGIITPFRSAGDFMTGQYTKLVGNVTLQDLSDNGPRFTFNATNAATGDNWRLQKAYSGEYRIGLIDDPKKNAFPLASVIAASAAFPPFLAPVKFDLDPNAFKRVDGADLYDQIELRKKLDCLDGGVYDNMGLETIWKRFTDLLVADAGGGPGLDMGPSSFWISELVRAYDLTIEQDRALRRRILYDMFQNKSNGTNGVDTTLKRGGAYWYMPWQITKYNVPNTLPVANEWPTKLAAIPTRLTGFSAADRHRLVNWGYALTDAAVRRWYQPSDVKPRWPYPEYSLEAPPA